MQPLWNEPALSFDLRDDGRRARWIAVSELHIGFESELARRGAFLKSRTGAMAEHLATLVRKSRARNLLILGDVKHRVGGISAQERRDVPSFFGRFSRLDRVLVARGNHDVGLRSLLPRRAFPNVEIGPASGVRLGKGATAVGALHGHARPKPSLLGCRTLLVGHTHAAVRLVNELGRAGTEWCWARGRLDAEKVKARFGRAKTPDIIVFPPFNALLGGSPINVEGLLGPFGRLAEVGDLRLTLLDGRDLGPVRALWSAKRPSRL